jgi:rhomboid protease GluP
MLIQQYLVLSTGKLTALGSITQVETVPPARYYTLRHCFIDKSRMVSHRETEITGKYSDRLVGHIYFVCPILESESDTLRPFYKAWLGIACKDGVSNNASASEKQRWFQAFYEASKDMFMQKDLRAFTYLDRIGYTDDREGYIKAWNNSDYYTDTAKIILLEAKTGSFNERTGQKGPWIFGSFGQHLLSSGSTPWFYLL